MTIAENVMMSDLARRARRLARARGEDARGGARGARAARNADTLDPDAKVEPPVGRRDAARRDCRAVRQRARVLVLDEPNSAISRRESERLFDVVRQLRGEGVTVIYVSHHLAEVLDLADRITIMRDGRTIETLDNRNVTEERLIRSMVGRDLGDVPPWRVNPASAIRRRILSPCR